MGLGLLPLLLLGTLPFFGALQSCDDAHSCGSDVLFVILNGIGPSLVGPRVSSQTDSSARVVRGVQELVDVFEHQGCSAEFRRRCFAEDNDMGLRYSIIGPGDNSAQTMTAISNFSNASVISKLLTDIAGE